MSKRFKTNAGPKVRFDWKYGLKESLRDGAIMAVCLSACFYMTQRVGFVQGAKATLDGTIDQIIKVKE